MYLLGEVKVQVEEFPWETSGRQCGQKVLILNVPPCLGALRAFELCFSLY